MLLILMVALGAFAAFILLIAMFGKLNKKNQKDISTNMDLAGYVNHENSGTKIEEYAPLFRTKDENGKDKYNCTYKGWGK